MEARDTLQFEKRMNFWRNEMELDRRVPLQAKIVGLVFCVVAAVIMVTMLLISRSINTDIKNSIGSQAMSAARMVAKDSVVREGLTGKRDPKDIQVYAQDMLEAAQVRFIVVIDMAGIRYSHPNPELVGQRLTGGDEGDALSGYEYISEAEGTLGYSLRAFTPVYDEEGRQVGSVLVGILLTHVQESVREALKVLVVASALGLVIGITAAWLLARNIKEILFGLEPWAIAKLLEERNVMLQSVREGVIAVDADGRITVINSEARRLLRRAGWTGDPIGREVESCMPGSGLQVVMEAGKADLDREQEVYGIPIVASRVPLWVEGRVVGAVATFRDKTELKRLAEELTGVQAYVDALRSRGHEFMNQLHVILGLVQMRHYEQLRAYISRIASDSQEEVSYVDRRIRDSVLAGFVLSKLSLARERDIEMCLHEDTEVDVCFDEDTAHELVTILGNLIENALDAVKHSARKEVMLALSTDASGLYMEIEDSGPGIPKEIQETLFVQGVSTKAADRGFGLALVQRSLARLEGTIQFSPASQGGTVFSVFIPSRPEWQYDNS